MTIPHELIDTPKSVARQAALLRWLARDRDTLPPRRQLSEAAQFILAQEAGWSTTQATRHIVRSAANDLSRLPSARPLLFVVVIVTTALLPLSGGPNLWATDEAASEFLSVLWQVMAGTLGIIVAAVLFLYEAYGSTIRGRYGITLVEYSSESGVTRLIGWLTASLILIGAVILGWGDGAPRGWAGFLALVVAARALIAFPSAFRSVANLVGVADVHELRRKFLKPRVEQAIRDDLMTYKMNSLFGEYLADCGLTASPFLDRNKPAVMIASTNGIVTDVDLAKMLQWSEGLAGASISVALFHRIRKGNPVAVCGEKTAAATPLTKPLTENFLIVTPWHRTTRYGEFAYLKELHQDSMRAIRELDDAQMESNLSLHEDLLQMVLDYERVLQARGLMSIVNNTDMLEMVRRYLYMQFMESNDAGAERISRAIAWTPISLMNLAADEGNLEVALQFLGLAGSLAVTEVSKP